MQYRKAFLCLVLQQTDFRNCFIIFSFIWFGFSISIVCGNILWLVMVREDPLVSVNDSRNLFGTVCSKPISEQFLACLGLAWQAVVGIFCNDTQRNPSPQVNRIFFSKLHIIFLLSLFIFFYFLNLFVFCFTNTLTPYRVGLLPLISFFYYVICSNNAVSIKCCYFSSNLCWKLLTWNFVRSYLKVVRCYYNSNHVLKVWYNLKNLGKNRFMCFWFTAALQG